jgi:hypothetical protein
VLGTKLGVWVEAFVNQISAEVCRYFGNSGGNGAA